MDPTYKVTVLPAGISFECGADETILEAASRNHFGLPYGCRKGNCGTCKAQVLDGDVDLEVISSYGLSEFEREQGFTLLCSAFACSDVTVEMDGLEASDVDSLQDPSETAGTITAIDALTHDIRYVAVDLEQPFSFRPGQFVQIQVPGTGAWRSYSMANPPSRPDRFEFIIKLVPEGVFSSFLEEATPGCKVQIRGPYGSFWIRDHDRPLLMIGGGAGMAPLLSMLRDLAERRDARRIRFYYGARTEADLFYLDTISELGAALPDFGFEAVLSHATPEDGRSWRRGFVTDIVLGLGGAIGEHDAYLCGPPPMIDAGLAVLEGHGLQERRSIFYDKFTAS